MTAGRPLTSILMPVRDEAEFIGDALGSISAPAGWPVEVVVIDDHSVDATAAIVAAIAAARAHALPIRLLANARRGKAAAVNTAIAAARGTRFVLMAGDDLLVSAALADRIAALDGDGPRIAQCRYRSFSDDPSLDGIDFPRGGRSDFLAGGATSFNAAFAGLAFPIPESLPNEDTWLRAIALLHAIMPTFVDRIGLHYRLHPGNSVGLTHGFAATDRHLADRHAAYALALAQAQSDGTGTAAGRARLAALAQAETLRERRRWAALALLPGLSVADRQVMLANATPWLFAVKRRLARRERRPA